MKTNEKTAKGTKGFILYSPFTKRYFFRVYKNDGEFVDYDINCEEIEVELISEWNSLYTNPTKNTLDWSSKALGKDNESRTKQ